MQKAEYKKMDEFQKGHWWYRGRRYIVKTLFNKYVGEQKITDSFLDVGCGTGEGSFVVQNPSQLTGIDESTEALSLAKGKGYGVLHEGSADQLSFLPSVAFQGILTMDVLEHVAADGVMLEECFRVAAPGAILLVTVPAFMWLWSKHDEIFGHKRRYTKGELVKKVEKAGFEVLFASYYVIFLLPLAVLFWLVEKFLLKHISKFTPLPEVLNRLFFSTLALEAMLFRLGLRLSFGSSIVLVARKNKPPLVP